ncbi:RNA exonuclease 4 [Halyomorpha halys]|uniref:RNA exonuclease 4 n=1 Tax=Halyomorpha halys TaxID=286706 RepID=UPI0006D51D87|nr:RNA exonuclease 4 [Halyomorpha halys]
MKSQVNCEGTSNKLNKKQKFKKSAITVSKSKLAVKNKVSKESNDVSVKFSNITHKKCTGTDNWKKFLESKGMSLKVQNNNVNKSNDPTLKPNARNRRGKKITKAVAMDCEMVGIGDDGEGNMLARVSLVNSYGDCIYDKYVKPRETVVDYRTQVSGIRPEDLKTAEEFDTVQKEVADILKTRILVGHALKNDLAVLFLTHPRYAMRDTAKFFCKKNKRTPSLKSLAAEYLQTTIQEGEHSSVQDAQAAMQLYNLYRKYWESGKGNKSRRRIDNCVSEDVEREPEI